MTSIQCPIFFYLRFLFSTLVLAWFKLGDQRWNFFELIVPTRILFNAAYLPGRNLRTGRRTPKSMLILLVNCRRRISVRDDKTPVAFQTYTYRYARNSAKFQLCELIWFSFLGRKVKKFTRSRKIKNYLPSVSLELIYFYDMPLSRKILMTMSLSKRFHQRPAISFSTE